MLRKQIISIGKEMYENKLITGTMGNISARFPGEDKFFITPSGMDYRALEPEDIVLVNITTGTLEGKRKPSTELELHRQIYIARPDVGAIVHMHSDFATAFAVARIDLPPVTDLMAQILGGGIRVAEHALPSSPELARNAVKALGDLNGALLANHGSVGVGADLNKAFYAALTVENSAKLFILASIIGKPNFLSHELIEIEKTKIAPNYGQGSNQ